MKTKMVENWAKLWWRRWSTWLAMLFGAILTAILADENFIAMINAWLSGDDRAVKAAIAGLIAAVVPVLVAHLRQPGIDQLRDD